MYEFITTVADNTTSLYMGDHMALIMGVIMGLALSLFLMEALWCGRVPEVEVATEVEAIEVEEEAVVEAPCWIALAEDTIAYTPTVEELEVANSEYQASCWEVLVA